MKEDFQKICVLKNTKDINFKVFNIITNKNEAKSMPKHTSCDCKCKFSSTLCNSKQKWDNKSREYQCKNYRTYKKNYIWNPITCICENDKHLKSIDSTSVKTCNDITSVIDIVSTKMANTIATNVSINSNNKK